MVTWLVQLETKIRNQATTRGKDFRTTLGPDPEFPAKGIAELMLCCTQGLRSAALWTVSNLHAPHMHTWQTSGSLNWDFSTNLRAKENLVTSYLSKGQNSTYLQVSSAFLLPWYTIQEISKCFSSGPLIWTSLTLTYGLYCYFKEKLLSNTWIFKHLFLFWIPLSKEVSSVRITIKDSGIWKYSQTRTQNLNKLSKSWILECRGGGYKTFVHGDLASRNTKVKKDLLDFSLSIQSCSDIKINSKIHHQFKTISLWSLGCLTCTSQAHPPESHSELKKHFRTLQSRTLALYPPMTLSWVNNVCFLKKYRLAILVLY